MPARRRQLAPRPLVRRASLRGREGVGGGEGVVASLGDDLCEGALVGRGDVTAGEGEGGVSYDRLNILLHDLHATMQRLQLIDGFVVDFTDIR